jgi:hypothetical protein
MISVRGWHDYEEEFKIRAHMHEMRLTINNNIQQGNHVGASSQIPKDLYLSFDFFCCNRLEDLDNALLVTKHIDAFENLL